MMEVLVIDTETSLHNVGDGATGSMAASPYCLDNDIVWFGWSHNGGTIRTKKLNPITRSEIDGYIVKSNLIVGHNLKFDLLHMTFSKYQFSLDYFFEHGGRLWDTQLAEYILTGQESRMVSLNSLCEKYELPLKDGRMKEYWEEGISTEDIPDEEIEPYLRNDVYVTQEICKRQLVLLKEQGQLDLMYTQMDALLATFLMERNGMQIDVDELRRQMHDVQRAVDVVQGDLIKAAVELARPGGIVTTPEWNPLSPLQQAAILYGGTIKGTVTVPVRNDDGTPVVYKTGLRKGQEKTKKQKKGFVLTNRVPRTLIPEDKKVGEKQLDDLRKSGSLSPQVKRFIEHILNYRSLKKDLSTYILPYMDLTWSDSRIHPQYNHTVTATGRLSSSNPNLQNVSGDK